MKKIGQRQRLQVAMNFIVRGSIALFLECSGHISTKHGLYSFFHQVEVGSGLPEFSLLYKIG